MSEVVYQSENLMLRYHRAQDASRVVVTFDCYGLPQGFDRPGFGEQFFVSRGIAVLTVQSARDAWYQFDDMERALAAARGVIEDVPRIMTYGSSMGAYAAIRFADRLGASACLALSPQYSNDPRKVPFECRWRNEGASTRWMAELDGPIACGVRPLIVLDPETDDARHVALIAADTAIDVIALPHTAHPVTTFLSAEGLLEELVLSVLDGTIDIAGFEARALALRETSSIYWCELARIEPNHRNDAAIALARRAVQASPGNDLAQFILANRLAQGKQFDESLPLFEALVERTERYAGYAVPYCEALAAAGHVERGLALAEDLAIRAGHFGQVHFLLGGLRAAAGDPVGAGLAFDRAHSIAPANPTFRWASYSIAAVRPRSIGDTLRRTRTIARKAIGRLAKH